MQIAQIGEAILRTPAKAVDGSEFHQTQFTQFIADLLATMLTANGIGIAAPQVFDSRAVMIIASRPSPRYPQAPQMAPLVVVNPRILTCSENTVWEWEGCLSVPGLRGNIERPDRVEVYYQDADGQSHTHTFEGFVARIFQHEHDHLIGKTWLDHIDSTQNVMAESVWQREIAKVDG
ncbi:MAG: peptide deformylase [Paraglaciecola sp.]|jgi:peptide deformylase